MVSVAELEHSARSVDDLINKVFPNFKENVVDSDYLSKQGTLAPLNESVNFALSSRKYCSPILFF